MSGDIPTADGSAGDATGSGEVRRVVIPDVLFRTDRWLESASLPSSPLRRVEDPTESLGAARFLSSTGRQPRRKLACSRARVLAWSWTSSGVSSSCSRATRKAYRPSGMPTIGSPWRRLWLPVRVLRCSRSPTPMSNSFRAAIVSQWPRLERRQHAYRLRLTHDVDFARASDDRSPKHLVRAVAGDVARRRDVDLARRRVSAFVERRREAGDPAHDRPVRYLCGSDVGQREAWHREHVLRDGQRRARIDRRQLRRVVAVDGRATHGNPSTWPSDRPTRELRNTR